MPYWMFIIYLISIGIGFKELNREGLGYKEYIVLVLLNTFLYQYKYVFILGPVLASQCVIDFKKMELSNINSLFIFVMGIIHCVLDGFDLKAIVFISVFYIVLYLLPFSNLGFGDVKLAIPLGLFIPYKAMPSFIFYSLCIGLFIGLGYKFVKKSKVFPMGPAIITSFIILNILLN
jgi:prepilin signal peptidase PulO-like enzyme (type II secretory pathway)